MEQLHQLNGNTLGAEKNKEQVEDGEVIERKRQKKLVWFDFDEVEIGTVVNKKAVCKCYKEKLSTGESEKGSSTSHADQCMQKKLHPSTEHHFIVSKQ